jgi:hypothetical protein
VDPAVSDAPRAGERTELAFLRALHPSRIQFGGLVFDIDRLGTYIF